MGNESDLVSIVMPVYNGSDFLSAAIDSALAQTWPAVEIIVVDDGSDDQGATQSIIASYGDRIRSFRKENGGVATALNVGLAEMRGEYFSWLSHDDVYRPRKVEEQVMALRAFGRPAVAFSDVDRIDANDKHLPKREPPKEDFVAKPLWAVLEGWISGCSMLIPRECFAACGTFDPALPTTQDYDMWFRLAFRYPFIRLPNPLILQRVHEAQGSNAPRHLDEASLLWMSFIDQLSSEKVVELAGDRQDFLERLHLFLRNTPYRGAIAGVEQLLLEMGCSNEDHSGQIAGDLPEPIGTETLVSDRLAGKSTAHRVLKEIGRVSNVLKRNWWKRRLGSLTPALSKQIVPPAIGKFTRAHPDRPAIAVFLHDQGGGAARFAAEFAENIGDAVEAFFVRGTREGIQLGRNDRGDGALLFLPSQVDALCETLRSLAVQRLAIVHVINLETQIIEIVDKLSLPFDLFFVDYYLAVEQPHLVDSNGRFVGDAFLPEPIWAADPMRKGLIDRADRLAACSADLAQRLGRLGIRRPITVALPPGTANARAFRCRMQSLAPREPLRIVTFGMIQGTKGRSTMLDVARLIQDRNLPIELHVVGEFFPSLAESERSLIRVHASDERNLTVPICHIRPHAAWFPFRAPETHSYVLTDAMMAGLPILASDIGAVPERVAGRPLTWLCSPDASAEEWLEQLQMLRHTHAGPRTVDPGPVGNEQFYRTDFLAPLAARRRDESASAGETNSLTRNVRDANGRHERTDPTIRKLDWRLHSSASQVISTRLPKTPAGSEASLTVIVPCFNSAAYLEERLQSILYQRYPITQLLLLDDASTDDTLEAIDRLQRLLDLDVEVIANRQNSGSPFAQWRAAMPHCVGELVWIAEADDVAHPEFLGTLTPAFADPNMGIAFANSLGIDSLGRVIQPDFRQFLSTRDKPIWNTSFSMPGPEFVSCYLSVENSIPNMSATVIRKKLLADALDRLESHLANMRMAGDWLVLAEILRESSISFTPHTLNACRKHDNSLTFKLDNWCHFKEVLAVKAHIMRDVPAARAHIVDSVGHAARLGTSLQLDEAKAAQLIRSAVGDGIIPPPDPFNAGGILS